VLELDPLNRWTRARWSVVALGTSGALTWFAPVQPYLGLVALGLLAWALRTRLRGEVACGLDLD
jgi:hypothetical protein